MRCAAQPSEARDPRPLHVNPRSASADYFLSLYPPNDADRGVWPLLESECDRPIVTIPLKLLRGRAKCLHGVPKMIEKIPADVEVLGSLVENSRLGTWMMCSKIREIHYVTIDASQQPVIF